VRGMDVQYFSGKVLTNCADRMRMKSGEYDQRWRVDLDRGGQGAIVACAIRRFGGGQRLRRDAEIRASRSPAASGLSENTLHTV